MTATHAGPRAGPRQARHPLWAVCAPGLEPLTAAELGELHLRPGRPEPGGVPFSGTLAECARANLQLRTASRVLLRLAELPAHSFAELERGVADLPWEDFLVPAAPLPRLRASSHASRLFHTGGIADAALAGIARRLGGGGVTTGTPAPEEAGGDVLLRLEHDRCTVSLDSSGELLHRRGYRQDIGQAPLRETLAAALLRLAGWRGESPLVDPCCGSGTVLLEGWLLAVGRAPGAGRSFACERWPSFPPGVLAGLRATASRALRTTPLPVLRGGDLDARTLAAARANAERAGAGEAIAWSCGDFEQLPPPPGVGTLVSNLPYGARLQGPEPLARLYRRLGETLRRRWTGWTLALLVAEDSPHEALGLRWEQTARWRNGGLAVKVLLGRA